MRHDTLYNNIPYHTTRGCAKKKPRRYAHEAFALWLSAKGAFTLPGRKITAVTHRRRTEVLCMPS